MICYISFIHCLLVASVIYILYIAFLLSCISNFFVLTVGHSFLLYLNKYGVCGFYFCFYIS